MTKMAMMSRKTIALTVSMNWRSILPAHRRPKLG